MKEKYEYAHTHSKQFFRIGILKVLHLFVCVHVYVSVYE